MSIEATIDGFLSAEEPCAIVIQGKWGIGKTHFWRHRMLNNAAGKPWTQRYSYVSLFGINSLPELKIALGVATEEFNYNAINEWRIKGSLIRFWWKSQRWASDAIQFIPKVGDRVSKLYQRASFYAVRSRVICLDDVERRGSGLSLRDVLGLVSYLIEDRKCRVVVILNEGQLSPDDHAVWNENKEKVFHGELTYAPTLSETIALGLVKDVSEPWYETTFSYLEKLGVSNIRLVHRTSRAIHLALRSVKDVELEAATVLRIASALPLLVYSAFGKGDGAPPMDIVLRVSGQRPLLAALRAREEVSAEEQAFEEAVRGYGMYLHTSLDAALVNMLQAGFPDSEDLSEAVREYQQNAESQRLKEAWHSAWNAYHYTLQDNRDEILKGFQNAWPPVSHREPAHSLQSLVKLLRLLGEPDLATTYIQTWIDQRRANGTNEFREGVIQSFTMVDDKELLEAIGVARTEEAQPMALTDAFELWMAEDHLIRDDVILTFAAASPDDVVQLLEDVRDENLVKGLRRILALHGNPGNPNWQRALDNFRAALQEIAGRSELSALRIRTWVGVEPAIPVSNELCDDELIRG